MPRLLITPSASNTIIGKLETYNGGTSSTDAPTALATLGGIPATERGIPNGPIPLNGSGEIDVSLLPSYLTDTTTVKAQLRLITGVLYTFNITNYNSWKTYTLSASSGTIELVDNNVLYRPDALGVQSITINSNTINIEVVNNDVVQPTILAPTNYSNNVPAYATITSSNLDIATGREIDKLLASDGAANDWYGNSVSVSGDGQWLAVGSFIYQSATPGLDKIYIYQRNGNSWTEVSTITENTVELGFTVSFNEDGSKLVVGSHISTQSATYGHAKVFTYTLVNGIPTKVNEFVPETADPSVSYGASVSLSKDSLVMVVGLHSYDTNGVLNSGIVYIYDWNATNNTWTYRTSIQEATPVASNYFGIKCSLNIDGNILAVSAYGNDTYGTDAGIVYIYDWNATTSTYDLRTYIPGGSANNSSYFSSGLSISGDGKILIGSSNEKVYVYQWNITTSTFDELYTLTASDAAANDAFGIDVSITTNKDLLVVGSRANDNSNGVDAGAVYTFIPEVHQSSSWELATDPNFTTVVQSTNNDTTNLTSWSVYDLLPATDYYARVKYTGTLFGSSSWSEPTEFTTEQQFLPDIEVNKLLASDGATSDRYGYGVSVSGDGQWLAVGADNDDNAQGVDAGKVYIYRRNGNSWIEVSTITEAFRGLGIRLSFNEDGSKLVVGSYISSSQVATYGHPKVFTYTLVNGIPTKVNEFVPETTDTTPNYGAYPAISKDSLVLAVGLHSFDTNGVVHAGIVYIYDWNATNNTWTYRTSVQEPTLTAGNYYGNSNSLNVDGNILAVAAVGNDTYGTDAGIVYIYDWNATTSTYDLRTTLISSDIAASDYFGYGLNISSNGSILVTSAIFKDTIAGTDAGKVYVYQWNSTTSTFDELYTLEASDAAASDWFGTDVSITTNKDLLVVGAAFDDNSNGVDAGAVYAFR